ncbi:MAG TPA: helix-turn-helix domain-containing protein [Caulobacteraceae bacterium]|nr:helix-turn-helix domain-containing protein [Caulobacteraceae bacterium]
MLTRTLEAAALQIRPEAAANTALGSGALPAIGPRLTFSRDEEIFGEGEPSDYIYQVLEGVVRTCRFLGDGRRQIEDFHLAGEYFGFETGEDHTCTAEAVGQVTLLLIRRGTLVDLAARDVAVAGRLLELTMTGLSRAQKHVAMLSRKGACERVAAFLLDFAERSGAMAFVELPMSRQEIGDYLGLTIETVSRTVTQLEAELLISLTDRRRVNLRNRSRLLQYCA